MDSVRGFCGAALVTRAGRVTLEVAAGLADAGTDSACTPGTRFQISSVSKQFAAVTALRLAESGQLDLTEPVARWLPGCPPQWQRVTLHHLLTHTAGVRHWDDAPGFDASRPMARAERLSLIQQAPLLTAPGTRWRYSSPGYLLAGHILEQAGGQPYPDLLAAKVLDPLELTATSVGDVPPGAAAARGYKNGEPVAPWPLNEMPGTGDLCSTVGDLARFVTALHTGSLVGRHSLQAMLTAHAPLPDGEGTGDGWAKLDAYGYGQYIGTIAGHVAYLHTGDTPGYQSLVVWLPGPAASVVILSNDEATDMDAVLGQLIPAAVDGEGP